MQSHADSIVKHARDCSATRIVLQLCLYATVKRTVKIRIVNQTIK